MDIITLAIIKKWINESGGGGSVTPEEIEKAVEEYLEEHPVQPTPIDDTLTQEGYAADAKAVGDAIEKAIKDLDIDLEELMKLVKDAIEGNIAIFNADGQVIDSETSLSDLAKMDYVGLIPEGSEATNIIDFIKGVESELTESIDTAVANAGHLKREIVEVLPDVKEADELTIYLIMKDNDKDEDNSYDEYMVINGAWEKIGDTKVDLTDYAKIEYVDKETETILNESKTYTDNVAKETLADSEEYTDNKVANSLSESKVYTDNAVADTLTESKEYTDTVAKETFESSKEYSDGVGLESLNDAKGYTDSVFDEAIKEAEEYTNSAVITTYNDAKAYVDSVAEDKTAEVKGYADAVSNSALKDAKEYTDSVAEETLASSKEYANDADANTLTEAKEYIDSQGYTKNEGTITSIKTSSPLAGNGTSGEVSLSHELSGVTAGSYGYESAQTPAFGESFEVNYEEVDETGHVKEISTHRVTIPDTLVSSDNPGLMSSSDKTRLDQLVAISGEEESTITGISTVSPLSGGGFVGVVELSHNESGVEDGNYGDTSAQTPKFGGTFKVNYEEVDKTGHLTLITSHNVTIPNTEATQSASGLMSASDKTKLDNVEDGATANDGTITGISVSSPLSGGGTSGAVALSHEVSGVSAGNYGDSSAQTPAFGDTFKVNYETVNNTGHITNLTSHNVTMPNTEATTSVAGLMSASDKSKLNGIATGATDNVGTITGITTNSPLSGSGTSGSVALSHASSGATAGSYGDSSAQTPAFGGTFKVNYETVNATGHVTALSSHNVTIPNTEATTSAAGLMSAEDKENLDSVSELADETYDMVMSGEANGWLMDENGNVILSDDDTGITMDWDICRVTYEAGTGLSLDGNFFNHSNQITAGSVGDNDERTLQFSETLIIPCITYDAQGHITDAGNITLTLPDAPSTIGTSTVGSGTKPIYLSSGTPTASSSTVGSTTQPVYLDSGTITAMSGALATTYGGTGNTSGRATYADITTTNPTSGTTYYLPFTTGISSGTNYVLNGNNGVRYNTLEGTTDTAGYGRLYLGNSTASGTAGNKYGALMIYGNTGYYWLITGNSSYPSANRTLYMPRSTANGYIVATGAGTGTAVGSSTAPVYINSGGIATACGSSLDVDITGNAATATSCSNIGTSTVGSTTRPIYLNAGTPTALTGTVGGSAKPVYMSSGTITVCSDTVGSGTVPVYMSSGAITASTSTVGSGTKPVYMSSGTVTASSSTVGSANNPVYMNSGTITACSWDDVTESDIDSIFATASPSGYPDDDDDDGKVAPGPEIVDPDDTDDGNSGNDNPDDNDDDNNDSKEAPGPEVVDPDDDDDGDDNPDGTDDGDDGDEVPTPDPGVVIPDDNDGSDDDNDNDSDDSDSDDTDSGDDTNNNDDSETNDNPDDLIETLPDDPIE